LGSGTDTGDGKPNVDGGTNTTEEELSLQEDLTVRDGNNVSGNVSGHITTLSLNDGKSGEGSTTELVIHLGSALEETRVEIEDITRVSLTTRGTTEKKGHLTISDGLLGQVIVDDQGVFSVVTEPLSHSTPREGGEVLERSGLRGGRSDDNRILHSVILL